MGLTAPELLESGMVDQVIPRPAGAPTVSRPLYMPGWTKRCGGSWPVSGMWMSPGSGMKNSDGWGR